MIQHYPEILKFIWYKLGVGFDAQTRTILKPIIKRMNELQSFYNRVLYPETMYIATYKNFPFIFWKITTNFPNCFSPAPCTGRCFKALSSSSSDSCILIIRVRLVWAKISLYWQRYKRSGEHRSQGFVLVVTDWVDFFPNPVYQ